jgi:biopolymer transport protein ExbB/TolQ
MKNAAFWTMMGGGVVAVAAPAIGAVGSVVAMTRGFSVLEKSGVAEPAELALAVGDSLTRTLYGLCGGGLGLVIFVVGFLMWCLAKKSPPPLPAVPPN